MHIPPVQLQLALARAAPGTAAARAAAALAAEGLAQALQPGQPVAQQGQLGLQFALVGHGPAAEDFQNQHGAVHHLHPKGFGQVAQLAAGQLTVKNGGFRLQIVAVEGRLGQLALTQHGAGLGRGALLHQLSHRLHVVGLGQGAQLLHAPVRVKLAQVQPKQQHLFWGLLFRIQIQFAHNVPFPCRRAAAV